MSDFKGHSDISKAFLIIDEQFSSMNEFKPRTPYDLQLKSTVSQLMVVYISRTIEGSIKNLIFTKAILNELDPAKRTEIDEILKKFQNPTSDKIITCIKDTVDIEINKSDFTDEQLNALGIIMNDRHKIAHSDETIESVQSIKSLTELEKHYNEIKKLIEKICDIFSRN